eukprot:2846689-Ditylum_brightwellii.AAC.1
MSDCNVVGLVDAGRCWQQHSHDGSSKQRILEKQGVALHQKEWVDRWDKDPYTHIGSPSK